MSVRSIVRISVVTITALALLGCHTGRPSSSGGADRDSFAPVSKAALSDNSSYFAGTSAGLVGGEVAPNEEYAHVAENGFLDPRTSPLSTFSIDVDTASYSNVRRMLNEGRLPPPEAVRVEEFVNYFPYAYPAPVRDEPFSVNIEVASCPWNSAHKLVHLGLQSRRIDQRDVPPRNLVFLLDVSGSMATPNKLGLLQQSVPLLVENLRPQDTIAIVVYAGAAGLVVPPTSGDNSTRILDAIAQLEAGGSTAGGAGIQLAYDTARQNFLPGGINRVILATDGDFNVGVSSHQGLLDLIEKERESGVFLTVLGVGTGNIQDAKMELLADHGNGNYAYLDSVAEARKVLVEEAGATLVPIAKDVKIQVEFNPERVASYRLIGYENRLMAAEDFADDTKDAGEIGAGHSVTALYEVVPGRAGQDGSEAGLRYQTSGIKPEALSDELFRLDLRFKRPDADESELVSTVVKDGSGDLSSASTDFRFAAAVAGFGMLLRRSDHAGDTSYAMVRVLARASMGSDPGGHRSAFLQVVDTAERLAD